MHLYMCLQAAHDKAWTSVSMFGAWSLIFWLVIDLLVAIDRLNCNVSHTCCVLSRLE